MSKGLAYHEETKHSYISVRLPGRGLDWENKPYPFKVYLDAPKVQLPKSFPSPTCNLFEALSERRTPTPRGIELSLIAELLFYTAGITRIKDYGWERVYFRASPATGNLHETELYLVVGTEGELEPGLYHFDPCEFSLSLLRRGDYRDYLARAALSHDVRESGLSVILSSVAWRNAWKYGPRSYRHWFWDGGALCANLLAVSMAEGLSPRVLMGFVDSEVNALIGSEVAKEAALAIVVLRGVQASSPGSHPPVEPIKYKTMSYSRREAEYPEIVEAYHTSCLRTQEEVERWRGEVAGMQFPSQRSASSPTSRRHSRARPLGETILLRGSTRRFSRTPIGGDVLRAVTEVLVHPIDADFMPRGGVTLLERFLIVNALDGTAPGSYLHEPSGGLLNLRLGDFRRIAGYLCLEQELGSDAALVLFLMTRLESVLRALGNRGYRAAQFEAGIRVGLVYLASYSLGVGATGLTFYDDDVREFFSPASEGMENMMTVAVGNPSYKSKPGRIHVNECIHPQRGRS